MSVVIIIIIILQIIDSSKIISNSSLHASVYEYVTDVSFQRPFLSKSLLWYWRENSLGHKFEHFVFILSVVIRIYVSAIDHIGSTL